MGKFEIYNYKTDMHEFVYPEADYEGLKTEIVGLRDKLARLRDELERCREMYKRDV